MTFLLDFISLKHTNAGMQHCAEELYTQSFPVSERRKWEDILINLQNPYFDFFVITDGGTFVGIISLWRFDKFAYIEHFAVECSKRQKGVGSQVLQLLKDKVKKPLVLEAEPPEDAISVKRINFYKKNGLSLLSEKYIQPPYYDGLPQVELKIMTDWEDYDFCLIKHTLYKHVYNVQP
ncbi:MAG: GNAT family N-acetyltransferase [Bacteroidales bacterium]|nr:GNAT family N-acetyltransferase [Bacteroidales bacterium]